METGSRYNLKRYLLFAFLLSWICQAAGSVLALRGSQSGFTVCNSIGMFGPLLAVLITCRGLKKDKTGVSWQAPRRGHVKWWFASWLLPIGLAVLGCVIFFLIFRAAFDPTMSESIIASVGQEAYDQTYGNMPPAMVLVMALVSVLGGALVNTLFAVGEEAGWRGYMYPALKARHGTAGGRLFGGLIWGVWHWPVMALAGYEYGWSVFHAPVWLAACGMLLFCVFTVAYGVILDWLYEKTGSIWAPAIGHGALNAAAGLGIYMIKPEWAGKTWLGPTPIGIIGGLPFLALAAWLLIKARKEEKE